MEKIKKFVAYYGPYKGMFFMDMFCALVLSAIDLFSQSLCNICLKKYMANALPI